MPAEVDLQVLLSKMDPVLAAEEYAFCTLDPEQLGRLKSDPIGTFREAEGITAILPRQEAERAGLKFSFPSRLITLMVHSSLDAVGFLARITSALAEHGISVNAISAYHHDHLFVRTATADRALQVLRDLQKAAREPDSGRASLLE
jgi:hypothetical protein